ncbi:hypothetical protein [Actinoplanes sp. NBRC 101535]|uniref:NACHT domain-containing protein n=1 Tax=Actinoplanes sp. NBRC 101535 TaxID=3032196 RepID=UPI0024A02A0C|nr:hypothetical protein [Actinoplanes sp. NBRC 101535]GLY04208.1 hypothetical protein Acsp01_45870 [Actinoplanes sp. NBRC 101535]
MPRSLSYADAVRLLGGQDSRTVTAIERVAGALMLGTAPVVSEVLGWFDAKGELVRLSHDLVRSLSERRSGLSRHSRTERLEAAHTVLVITSFFEALNDVRLPLTLDELALTAEEQAGLTGRRTLEPGRSMVLILQTSGQPQPQPQEAPEAFRGRLLVHYTILRGVLQKFVDGLSVVDSLDDTGRRRLSEAFDRVPEHACRRYDESFRRLAADFPEVACWAGQREHRATRAALAELEEALQAISTGRAPDERRESLARAYQAELKRPVVESGDAPEGIVVPALCEAYLPPRFRAAGVSPAARISEESWWSALPVRDDLREFLIGHLTSPQAVRAPLLVLGQPGSGKSVLTRVLAARLPAADFLPVRVVLRDVTAAEDFQDRLEHAVRKATGERVDWPALIRSAPDTLPVILLDGFDELLQATGVSQTDYLVKVAAFQRREAEQGRPTAVIVTSRTAVADRARTPEETVALRLEPFDDGQVRAWLDIWNAANPGTPPVPAATVLAHPDLAEQPLLLLMLALYAGGGGTLQQGLHTHQLYERLLHDFAEREVAKHRPGLPGREFRDAVENELRRLSVVAFAMFNRGAQWVTEAGLDDDLTALLGHPGAAPASGLRPALRDAERQLGRFFFIHRARAAHDDTRMETYEFLHATFGEYLVARLTCQVLADMAARESASTMSFGAAEADDDLLRALLSFQPLSARTPIMTFLAALAPADGRDNLRNILIRLFRAVPYTPPAHRFAAYRPSPASEPARYAAYSANLLLLCVFLTGELAASDLYGPDRDIYDAWHSDTLLWHSQLSHPSGWISLTETIELDRIWSGGRRDLRLAALPHRSTRIKPVDVFWTLDISPDRADRADLVSRRNNLSPASLRQTATFAVSSATDVTQHTVEPLYTNLGFAVTSFVGSVSAAHLLMRLWTNPSPEIYLAATDVVTRDLQWTGADQRSYSVHILDRLQTDPEATADLALSVLDTLLGARLSFDFRLLHAFLGVMMRFLGRNSEDDALQHGLLERLPIAEIAAEPTAPAWLLDRIAELTGREPG